MTDRIDSGDRDRIEGNVDEVKGRGKEAWGDATGDEQTRVEGQADQTQGKAKQAWGDAKDKAQDLKDKVGG